MTFSTRLPFSHIQNPPASRCLVGPKARSCTSDRSVQFHEGEDGLGREEFLWYTHEPPLHPMTHRTCEPRLPNYLLPYTP